MERPKGYTYYFTELNPKNARQENYHEKRSKLYIEENDFECIEIE
jgi:hypothetical protein